MHKLYHFYLLTFFLLCLACNPNANSNQQELAQEVKFPLNIQKGGNSLPIDQIRAQCRTLIDHRIEQNSDPMAMLTVPFWWPEFVYDGQKFSKENEYAGYWLKFEDDFSYTYGQYKTEFGKGKYYFDLDSKILSMLDTNIELEPKFWTANYNGSAIVLVGKHEYGINNGMQIKMIALDERPEK